MLEIPSEMIRQPRLVKQRGRTANFSLSDIGKTYIERSVVAAGLHSFTIEKPKPKSIKKGADGMDLKNQTAKIEKPQEPYRFKKRIGSTTFTVGVYFDPDAKETAHDKIMRLVRNEAAYGKAANL